MQLFSQKKSVLILSILTSLLMHASVKAANPKELGRLLTTPDERIRMDNFRASKSQLGVDKSLTYRGTVLRQGRDWIWLNNQVLDAREDSALHLYADRSLSITVGEQQYRLLPGQTLVPSQGKIVNLLKNGRLIIRH